MIRLPFTVTNAAAQSYLSTKAQLLSGPSLVDWFQADPNSCVQSGGKVTTLTSLTNSGHVFAQADTNKQGSLVQVGANGYTSLQFTNATNATRYT
ncbi:hypothetical protein, partial [Nitrospirillum amazonense]|uniref:hypothetical protein n=1 Tax=Nitrospirillum amazonense TaxID=28077 RepID=UPI002412D4C3